MRTIPTRVGRTCRDSAVRTLPRTIPTRVGRTLNSKRLSLHFRRRIGSLSWLERGLLPFLGDHPQAADLDAFAVGGAGGFDFEALAIRVTVDNQQADTGGVALDILDRFLMGAPVECADEDIGPGFDEPAFEHAANGIGRVVGDDDRSYE